MVLSDIICIRLIISVNCALVMALIMMPVIYLRVLALKQLVFGRIE
jgi:hypothetical protein